MNCKTCMYLHSIKTTVFQIGLKDAIEMGVFSCRRFPPGKKDHFPDDGFPKIATSDLENTWCGEYKENSNEPKP